VRFTPIIWLISVTDPTFVTARDNRCDTFSRNLRVDGMIWLLRIEKSFKLLLVWRGLHPNATKINTKFVKTVMR